MFLYAPYAIVNLMDTLLQAIDKVFRHCLLLLSLVEFGNCRSFQILFLTSLIQAVDRVPYHHHRISSLA